MQLLNRQIAVVNFKPLRQSAVTLFLGATAYLPGECVLVRASIRVCVSVSVVVCTGVFVCGVVASA